MPPTKLKSPTHFLFCFLPLLGLLEPLDDPELLELDLDEEPEEEDELLELEEPLEERELLLDELSTKNTNLISLVQGDLKF